MLNVGSQTFETFKLEYYPQSVQVHMDTLFKICRNYAHNFSPKSENLYFHGLPGLGKTFLSCCIARLVADSGFSVVYETAVGLVSKLEKVKFRRNEDDELEAEAERYAACDLLILDDLGTEMKTAFTISAVYDVINARLITKHPTIVNSNLSPDELYADYSPQIASRLSGEYAPLHFLGTDIRQQRRT
jgi:DNA replication protein DnaC